MFVVLFYFFRKEKKQKGRDRRPLVKVTAQVLAECKLKSWDPSPAPHSLGMVRQKNQKFKVILRYTVRGQPPLCETLTKAKCKQNSR